VLSSGLSFKQPLVEEEIKYTAVKCFMQDYEEPIPPPPPPCMLPECLEAIIRVVNIESECTCIDPPPPPVEEIVEQIIEPVPVIAPAPCVVGAYKNGEWMSYLRNYINPDSIDHSEVPYNNYTVLFQYQVLPDGTVTNLIIDGDEFGAGRMLRKAFEQTTLKWVPAIVDGQPVPATYQQMIIFYPDNNTPVSIGEPQLLRFDSWL
jgi:hypothetical protein